MSLPAARRVTLALTGLSCAGKSTIATALGQGLSVDVLHCGAAIKRRASEMGIHWTTLPLTEHQTLDAVTQRHVASSPRPLVAEGRFLDFVLATLPNVLLFRLVCAQEERVRRLGVRDGLDEVAAARALAQRDQEDIVLQKSLWRPEAPILATFRVIDTTALSVPDVVGLVKASLGEAPVKC